MRINCLEFGEKGQSIVFLHGWQQDSRSFLPLVPFLSKKYRLFLLDLPGFGKSEMPPDNFSSFDYARIIVNWLKKRKLKQFILVGHSFGGKIAAIIAAENPKMVLRLILIASAGIPHTNAFFNLTKFIPKIVSEKIPFNFKKFFAGRDYQQAGVLLPIFKIVVKEDIRPVFTKINIPTLIIWGKSDQELPISDGRKIQSLIKKSKLILVKGDHFPFWENPEKIARLIDQLKNEKF